MAQNSGLGRLASRHAAPVAGRRPRAWAPPGEWGSQLAQLMGQVQSTSDAERLRAALGAFATGVTVVTSDGEGGLCGVTANSFSSLSLMPPLVLVCLRRGSSAARAIASNGVFAVNVLDAEQEALARRFASAARPRGPRCFHAVAHRVGLTGAPLIAGVACWLDCALTATQAAGDHLIVIGQILAYEADRRREPLVFHGGRYRALGDCGARCDGGESALCDPRASSVGRGALLFPLPDQT
jgi:flavin reductase